MSQGKGRDQWVHTATIVQAVMNTVRKPEDAVQFSDVYPFDMATGKLKRPAKNVQRLPVEDLKVLWLGGLNRGG
jgi:hypothetical protein